MLALQYFITLNIKRLDAFTDDLISITRIFYCHSRKQGRACSFTSTWKYYLVCVNVLFNENPVKVILNSRSLSSKSHRNNRVSMLCFSTF